MALWVSLLVAVAVGYLAAPSAEPVVRSIAVVFALGVAWVLTAVAAVQHWRGGGVANPGRAALFGVMVLLAAVRGATAASTDAPGWREAERGVPAGIREFAVLEASMPTGRCDLLVSVLAGERGAPGTNRPAVLLSVPASLCPRAAGDVVAVRSAGLRLRAAAELPGDPAPIGLARAQGAVAVAWVDDVWLASPAPRPGLLGAASMSVAQLRHAAWDASRRSDADAFVVASALGLRRALPPARRAELRAAGLGHLIAVSGLHVGIAAWFFARTMLRVGTMLGGSVRWGLLPGALVVVCYVLLTGAAPSAVRAGIMACLAGAGAALGRPTHGLLLLAAASAAMLLWCPSWVRDAGFQLSVVAMAVLVRSPSGAGLVHTTWRITWAIVPVALLHFGRVGLYAVVTNLIAVPILTLWTLPLGLVGGLLVPWFGEAALLPASWGASAILEVSRVVDRWPRVPVAAVTGAAVASLAIGLGHRALRRSLHPSVRACLVPRLAAIAIVIATTLLPHAGDAAPDFAWVVIGSIQRHALVIRGARATDACIADSVLPGPQWPAVLEALGIQRVVEIRPGRGDPPTAPHLQDLAAALDEAAMLAPAPNACPTVARRQVVDALRHCRRLVGSGRATAMVDVDGRLHCFASGRWVPRAHQLQVD